MSSRRPLILMAVLLVLVLGYVARPYLPFLAAAPPAPAYVVTPPEPPLPGENSISNVVVHQNDGGVWQVSFDYYYTGAPQFLGFAVRMAKDDNEPEPRVRTGLNGLSFAKRGSHSATAPLPYPGEAGVTRSVEIRMTNASIPDGQPGAIAASARVDQIIEWPDGHDYGERHFFASHSPEENLNRAIELIDRGRREPLEQARTILEKLIQKDPAFVQAYVELARVAMKTNWGPEGLHHAEGLLSSALAIEPDNANAKILMGYVYTHQERYKAADAMYADAAKSDPRNLWLWANWGEMLAMQGKFDQAAEKYREAVRRPMTHDTYDRARSEAYDRLFKLLERKKDLDGMEALHRQSVSEFGETSCFGIAYANFLLNQRGDAAGAIELGGKALTVECRRAQARQIVGLAHYLAWSKSEGAAREQALTQARVYLPPGPLPLYLLARSEKTADVAAQLLKAGEKIDQRDNDKLNALAHAIQNEDLHAMRRLLRLGAKPDAPVGYNDMPVALMPVLTGNIEMIRLMQHFGADYAKISYEGATAFDFAEQTGDPELNAVLSRKPQTL